MDHGLKDSVKKRAPTDKAKLRCSDLYHVAVGNNIHRSEKG